MYRDADGKQRSAGTYRRKLEAASAADRAEKQVRNDPEALGTLTFAEFLPVWRAQRVVQPNTAQGDESKLTNRVVPKWGEVFLRDIRQADVQAWIAEMSRDGLAASTIQKHVNLLSSVMRAALAAGKLPVGDRGEPPTNPCKGVTVPKPDPSPERYLSDAEVTAVRDLLEGFDRFVFDVLIGTGARWGEAVALTWDHVDVKNRTVEIAIAYDRAAKGFKATKGHAKRVVPLGGTLAGVLADRLRLVGFGEPPSLPFVKVPKPRSALLLGNAAGLPYDSALFSKRLDAAGRAAVVEVEGRKRKVGHIRPHDLRHTYASRLVQRGVPIQEVQQLLGHQSIATTQRYARLGSSGWDAVRNALG